MLSQNNNNGGNSNNNNNNNNGQISDQQNIDKGVNPGVIYMGVGFGAIALILACVAIAYTINRFCIQRNAVVQP